MMLLELSRGGTYCPPDTLDCAPAVLAAMSSVAKGCRTYSVSGNPLLQPLPFVAVHHRYSVSELGIPHSQQMDCIPGTAAVARRSGMLPVLAAAVVRRQGTSSDQSSIYYMRYTPANSQSLVLAEPAEDGYQTGASVGQQVVCMERLAEVSTVLVLTESAARQQVKRKAQVRVGNGPRIRLHCLLHDHLLQDDERCV